MLTFQFLYNKEFPFICSLMDKGNCHAFVVAGKVFERRCITRQGLEYFPSHKTILEEVIYIFSHAVKDSK